MCLHKFPIGRASAGVRVADDTTIESGNFAPCSAELGSRRCCVMKDWAGAIRPGWPLRLASRPRRFPATCCSYDSICDTRPTTTTSNVPSPHSTGGREMRLGITHKVACRAD